MVRAKYSKTDTEKLWEMKKSFTFFSNIGAENYK
jgi:hypothetical protein